MPHGRCHDGQGREEEWQKALKNLESVALNKWPHYSSANKFKGLKWCQLRRIMLQGFQLERVVYQGSTSATKASLCSPMHAWYQQHRYPHGEDWVHPRGCGK